MNFKDFNDFKLKLEEMNNNDYQESLNDLFYFFKDQVEKDEYKEWRPNLEVTYFGLGNEFDKGVTFTLGEVSEFLKTKFFSGKIEAVENFHNNTKDVKEWTPPEAKVSETQTTNVQRESNSIRNDDDDLEIDRNISVDDEENFNDQGDEEPEEESFEEFLEDFLGDDEDSNDKTIGPKGKKKKKKKVKVLGEELPFEDDDGSNRQKEMATEKAVIEEAKNRHEGNIGTEVEVEIEEANNGDKGTTGNLEVIIDEQPYESIQEVSRSNTDFGLEDDAFKNKDVTIDTEDSIGANEQYNQGSSIIPEAHESSDSVDSEQHEHTQNENDSPNMEPSVPSTEVYANDDGLLEIDFGEDVNNSEEAKLVKLMEEQEKSSVNPILGAMAGISKVLNGKDYEYQGEDAKLFGQHDSEELNHQKEAATEAAIIELAKKRAEQNVQIELIEEDSFGQTGSTYGHNETNRNHKTMEEALNETINKMGESLDNIEQYDENGQVIHPEAIIDKILSEDENAAKAFQGHGSAGDMSAFGQAFKDFASQIGNDNNSAYGNGSNVADILNGLVMGMAFTGTGDQIREISSEPVIPPVNSTIEDLRGVHNEVKGPTGADEAVHVDFYGHLTSENQDKYHQEMKDNRQIGQDTRDIQQMVDASIADKDARDAVMVQSYGQEMITMPASTMMQGEDFNRVYMEHFADVTAVEFSATPIPENVSTVDFSAAGNGAVLGYEENGVLYITAAPPAGSDLSMVTEPQVYLNPDSAGMFKDAVNLQSVSFGDNIADTSYVHNMGGMFINCENLTTVNADYLNTERLQNIDGLFANCSNLETFNNEGWKTSSIVTASFAFSECHALMQDPSANWHMENLRYADGFMSGCTSLTNIDMSDWNARSLLSTREMFNGCTSAEYININGLDTINVRDMAGMFKCCESLEDINLSKLNTSSLAPVVDGKGGVWSENQGNLGHPIDDIFYGCTKLAENGEFKSQAMAWENSANRAVELNSPVYMENKSHPTSYEQLSIPVMTEVQNKDGSISRMTSYHNQDGSTTFVIPSTTPQSNYERMIEVQAQYSDTPILVMSKPNNDGTTSVITSKTYADNSRVVQTEVVGVDGQVIQGNVVSYDRFGTQISDIPLNKIDVLSKNNPLFISSKMNEDGTISVITSRNYEDNSRVIKTETYGKDGVVIKENIISFDGNGVKMTEIPTSKLEDLAMTSAAVVLATVNRDGTSSVVTSKSYADNSYVVKTEMVGRDGNVVKENVNSYDKNGNQMFSVPADKMQDIQQDMLKLSSLKLNEDGTVSMATTKTLGDNSKIINTETFSNQGSVKNKFEAYDKNGVLISNIPASKLEDLFKENKEDISIVTGPNGNITIVTSKVFTENSKIVKSEEFSKDGVLLKESIIGYDKNNVSLENIPSAKLEELLNSNIGSIELKKNEDGTVSIVTSKLSGDNIQTMRTEVLAKDGSTLKDTIATYDKNGIKVSETPVNKFEEALKTGSILVTSKVDKDGIVSVIIEKAYADKTRVVQTEIINKDGTIIKDIISYDPNGKKTANISQDKIDELAAAKKIEINKKNDGHQVIVTIPKTDGTKATTTINVEKNGKHITNSTIYGKDGNMALVPVNNKLDKIYNQDEKTKRRREDKGNGGHAFGDSKSSNARRIFDDATFKRDQNLYKAQKVVEGFGRDSKTAINAAKQGIKKVIENPQDDSLASETYRKLEKYKGVAKDVVSGIFGVSIAASLKAEQVNFKNTMKVAEMTKGLESQGLNLKILEGKSQKEVVESLSGLKDSHGKRLLSEKQIKNIAKYRNGAVDMINFDKAMTNARDIGLFRIEKGDTSLTKRQIKTLERFKSGRLDKLSSKDIANLADAYFKRSKSSTLRGVEVSKFSKTELDSIINGKHSVIDWNKLSDTEKNIFKGLRRSASIESKRKSIRNNQTLKRLNPFRMSNVMNAFRKTGSGLAEETAQLYSTTTRTIGSVYRGASTALDIARIYGGIAAGVGGRMMRSKIIVKARGKAVEALGQTKIGRRALDLSDSIKKQKEAKKIAKQAKKDLKEMKKEAKLLRKTERNNAIKNKAKETLKKGAKKAADKAQRTAAGKLAAKAALRLKAMTNNRAFKMAADIFGWSKGVLSVPLKALGKVGHFLGAVKAAINKLLLYLAAGLIGFFLMCIVFIAIISMFTGGGSTGITINSSIMSPPAVDEQGDPLDLTEEEQAERWEDFKVMLQEKYQDSKDAQEDVLDNVEDIFNEVPEINGNPVVGWAGDQIMEYGVPTDPDNQGCWIAYNPTADDNAKDAIAFAYVIMGSDDFYYEEEARDKLIEDLIEIMNPKVDESNIINTINPMATYADDDKKIYACLTGCDSLTYYCANDDAYTNFSKSGCVDKDKNYVGTSSVKELEYCVRLSTDGTTIITDEYAPPDENNPVIYADELESHTYGDSYISTCTGNESVTIKYYYMGNDWVPVSAREYFNAYSDYYRDYDYFSDGRCGTCPYYGEHYHFIYGSDRDSDFDVLYEDDLELYKPVEKGPKYYDATLAELGLSHGQHEVFGGIDNASQVVGPTRTISGYSNSSLANFVEDETGRDVTSASFETTPSSTCTSWEVEFKCDGHPINTCPNGHTDLGVTVSQYSVEDFSCFESGGAVQLPSNSIYQSHINEFMALETREGALSIIKAIIENDWQILYGIAGQDTLSIAENSKVSEAYIYNFLVSEPNESNIGIGLGMTDAQAAAMLGYIKVASDFQINKEYGGYYGLCLWGEDQLERIGRGSSDNQATLLEQLTLLNNEWGNTISSCGFQMSNDLIEFRSCEDTVEGVTKAAEILATKWTFGHVDNVGAVQSAAVSYFNRMNSGSDKDFANPCLATINNYVSWALKTAASTEHGYCQGKFQNGSVGDFNCGTFVNAAIREGTKGTDDEVAGWPDGRFQVLTFPSGATEADLQFGDLIYDPMEAGDTSDHIEIYIGNGCSVGARGADGNYGCSQSDERWQKHQSAWIDHVFHKSGDQGIRWKNGSYSYNEIAASSSDLSKYKTVYRLMP